MDWGLGHATRMVPIIDMLKQKGAEVVIGADNRPLAFLQQRFPDDEFVKLPGFNPSYPEKGSVAGHLIQNYPRIKREAKKAHLLLQKIILEKKIDIVISDNRYEMYSDKTISVFITHQLNIQTSGWQKLADPFIKKIINRYIRHYDELWIPDNEGQPNLSGELSHVKKMPIKNTHYIGALSRFSGLQFQASEEPTELLLLLSGPEPQRSILEKMLTEQALKTGLKTVILQGKPEESETHEIENVKTITHLSDSALAALIDSANLVISRPGYSTIMDLAVFGKKAIFIPTPEQTEQEYLAKELMYQGIAYSHNQSGFSLKMAIMEADKFTGINRIKNDTTLEERINLLLK